MYDIHHSPAPSSFTYLCAEHWPPIGICERGSDPSAVPCPDVGKTPGTAVVLAIRQVRRGIVTEQWECAVTGPLTSFRAKVRMDPPARAGGRPVRWGRNGRKLPIWESWRELRKTVFPALLPFPTGNIRTGGHHRKKERSTIGKEPLGEPGTAQISRRSTSLPRNCRSKTGNVRYHGTWLGPREDHESGESPSICGS